MNFLTLLCFASNSKSWNETFSTSQAVQFILFITPHHAEGEVVVEIVGLQKGSFSVCIWRMNFHFVLGLVEYSVWSSHCRHDVLDTVTEFDCFLEINHVNILKRERYKQTKEKLRENWRYLCLSGLIKRKQITVLSFKSKNYLRF